MGVSKQAEELKTGFHNQLWQTIHMAAAASCRALSGRRGQGHYYNQVYPRTKDHSCNDVCASTFHNKCEAALSIIGFRGKVSTEKTSVGQFFNYGCASKGDNRSDKWEINHDVDLSSERNVVGYCCC